MRRTLALASTLLSTLLLVGSIACSDDDGNKKKDGAVADARMDGQSRDLPSPPDGPSKDGPKLGDARGDVVPPAPDGPRRDVLITGDALAFPQCAAAGGGCTVQRWDICPAGQAPTAPDPNLDCGFGYCCVSAPASTCTQDPGWNCLPGKQCPSCWGPPSNTGLTCPADQVCCNYICD